MKRLSRISALALMIAWTWWIWTTVLDGAIADGQACYELYGQGSERCESAEMALGFGLILVTIVWLLGMAAIEVVVIMFRRFSQVLSG